MTKHFETDKEATDKIRAVTSKLLAYAQKISGDPHVCIAAFCVAAASLSRMSEVTRGDFTSCARLAANEVWGSS